MAINRILRLTKTTAKFVDERAVTVSDGDTVEIEVDSVYDLSEAVITLSNGSEKISTRLTHIYTIPKQLLFSGWLSVKVDMYLNGEKVKSWVVLPLKIVELKCDITPDTAIISIDDRLTELEQNKASCADLTALQAQLRELAEKHNKLAEIVGVIKEY